ncbi:hypothetical protein Q4596_03490 [Pseudoalteromonas carrageenovora]|uniref:hypothetical protein n=1 Tax=Pseudoalteromonas carrageenovora TaxID=227 RepID=UPI0026E25C09|nr:hypothetical protein [Pseudoalteromonas carrageenovora]MDO6834669.1 hypothetical protein [Pseudoalteromonas carrageenovora]
MDLSAEKLELHYYFNDSSHSMNAFVRNQCESEFLAIAMEIAKELELGIQLESEAYREGGLKEAWKIIGKNGVQVSIFISIMALVSSRIPFSDPELDILQKQHLRLSIEEKKLRIKKLQTELENEKVNESTVNQVAELLEENLKVATRKSNFYRQLSRYNKVEKIGLSALNSDGKPVTDERIVSRNSFRNFIIHSHNLSPITVDDALVEIIAPVLKEGRYKWKGVYENEPISFSMNDKYFNLDVLNEVISFKHGTTIECVLLIHQKLDEAGEVQITGYSVSTVIRKIDSGEELETLQGKKYKFNKKQVDAQADLFT